MPGICEEGLESDQAWSSCQGEDITVVQVAVAVDPTSVSPLPLSLLSAA